MTMVGDQPTTTAKQAGAIDTHRMMAATKDESMTDTDFYLSSF